MKIRPSGYFKLYSIVLKVHEIMAVVLVHFLQLFRLFKKQFIRQRLMQNRIC